MAGSTSCSPVPPRHPAALHRTALSYTAPCRCALPFSCAAVCSDDARQWADVICNECFQDAQRDTISYAEFARWCATLSAEPLPRSQTASASDVAGMLAFISSLVDSGATRSPSAGRSPRPGSAPPSGGSTSAGNRNSSARKAASRGSNSSSAAGASSLSASKAASTCLARFAFLRQLLPFATMKSKQLFYLLAFVSDEAGMVSAAAYHDFFAANVPGYTAALEEVAAGRVTEVFDAPSAFQTAVSVLQHCVSADMPSQKARARAVCAFATRLWDVLAARAANLESPNPYLPPTPESCADFADVGAALLPFCCDDWVDSESSADRVQALTHAVCG
ncbi:hypothetical protein EON68_03960, partial [archaeon]